MKQSDLPYLSGVAFSNGRAFRTERTVLVSRARLLEREVSGQRVLHVGFADHLPLIPDKRATGVWLHDILCQAAERCVGIDLDEEVVAHLRDLGVPDIHAIDLTESSDVARLNGEDFDVVVLGEVLEHIGNPVAFLRAVREGIGVPEQRIIITVPNAWNLRAMLNLARGIEAINTDHRFWFTPYTLAKVMTDAGWSVDEIVTVTSSESAGSIKGQVANRLITRFGLLRPTVVGIGHLVH